MDYQFMSDFIVAAVAQLIVSVVAVLVVGFGIFVLLWGARCIKKALSGDLTSDEKKRIVRKISTGSQY